MRVADFITEFRRVTGDGSVPYLWSDEDILAFLIDAINEACERALLIEDRTTARCCTLALVADQDTYRLHTSVIKVKRVTYAGRALTETSVEAMDQQDANWESRTGTPLAYIQTEGKLRVIPIPTAAMETAEDELALTVYRRPLEDVALTGDLAGELVEIPARYHLRLMSWVYHRAYTVEDPELKDLAKAATWERKFAGDFGERIDANVQRKQRDRKPPVIRFRF
jgi:hypothetical protein